MNQFIPLNSRPHSQRKSNVNTNFAELQQALITYEEAHGFLISKQGSDWALLVMPRMAVLGFSVIAPS